MIVNRNTLLANHILKSNSRNEKKNSQKPNERAFKPHTLQRCSHKNTSLIRECYCCVYLSLYYYYIFFFVELSGILLSVFTHNIYETVTLRPALFVVMLNTKLYGIRAKKKKSTQHS